MTRADFLDRTPALARLKGVSRVFSRRHAVVMAVHGTVLVLGGRLLRADPDAVAVASQANVGGGTTALAVARSLGRGDLALPAILVGSLGTAVGTYAGFFAAGLLSR